jgi:hypothetical protein
MSAARVVPLRATVPVVRRRHVPPPLEDFDSTREDAQFFRSQTLAIVRHFFEIACQIGRLSSILGREFFRARVSHHAVPSFEDQAVFVHDVERALARLNPQDADVIGLVGLYQYSTDEVATLLGRSRSYVANHFADSLDRLAGIFLETGLLREDRPDRRVKRLHPVREPSALPPKKPAASVRAGEFHEVTGQSAKYSFTARRVIV